MPVVPSPSTYDLDIAEGLRKAGQLFRIPEAKHVFVEADAPRGSLAAGFSQAEPWRRPRRVPYRLLIMRSTKRFRFQ